MRAIFGILVVGVLAWNPGLLFAANQYAQLTIDQRLNEPSTISTQNATYSSDLLRATFFNRLPISGSCSSPIVVGRSETVLGIQQSLRETISAANRGQIPAQFSDLKGAAEEIQVAYLLLLMASKYEGVSKNEAEGLIMVRFYEFKKLGPNSALISMLKADIEKEVKRLVQDRRAREEELKLINQWLSEFVARNPGLSENLVGLNARDKEIFLSKQQQFEVARCQMIKDRNLAYDLRTLQLVRLKEPNPIQESISEFFSDQWQAIKEMPGNILPAPRGFDKL